MMLFDTHAHVSDEKFDDDRDAMLARAKEAGLVGVVDVGISVETSERAVATARAHEGVYAAVGVHPYDGQHVDEAAIRALDALCDDPNVVAIGETGFDFFRMRSPRDGQERGFRLQLDLAAKRGLPVILHLRSSDHGGEGASDAYEACLDVLSEYEGRVTPLAHCFSATPEIARRFVALGGYVSFAGNATYPKAEVLRDSARVVPLDRLLVETDCPYLAPQPRRGKRNEPAFVRFTAEGLAKALGVGAGDLARATCENAKRLFGLL